jgi:hypothetical protein
VNKILKILVNKRKQLVDENKREIQEMKRFMKKFLFLFNTNPYTDAHEFSYKDQYKGKWFANMTYYPSSGSCHINTGTYHPEKQIVGGYTQFDKPPDINKLQKAIRIVMEQRNKSTEERTQYIKNARNMLGGIKL